MQTNTNANQLSNLLASFFNALTQAYPGKTIQIAQPTENTWSFGGTSPELYLWATADTEDTITLYASDSAEIEESGCYTNTLNTELGTIIIAEDF